MKHTTTIRHLGIALISFAILATSAQAFNFSSLFGSRKDADKQPDNSVQGLQQQLSQSLASASQAFAGTNPDMVNLLGNIEKASAAGQDLAMVRDLAGLAGGGGGMAMMTPQQQKLLGEVKGHAQALALTRNFSDDPALEGPVREAVQAVQSADALAAARSLKTISDHAALTPLQRNLVTSMLGEYGAYLDKAGAAADTVRSLNSLF